MSNNHLNEQLNNSNKRILSLDDLNDENIFKNRKKNKTEHYVEQRHKNSFNCISIEDESCEVSLSESSRNFINDSDLSTLSNSSLCTDSIDYTTCSCSSCSSLNGPSNCSAISTYTNLSNLSETYLETTFNLSKEHMCDQSPYFSRKNNSVSSNCISCANKELTDTRFNSISQPVCVFTSYEFSPVQQTTNHKVFDYLATTNVPNILTSTPCYIVTKSRSFNDLDLKNYK